jgi:hypothetical protein
MLRAGQAPGVMKKSLCGHFGGSSFPGVRSLLSHSCTIADPTCHHVCIVIRASCLAYIATNTESRAAGVPVRRMRLICRRSIGPKKVTLLTSGFTKRILHARLTTPPEQPNLPDRTTLQICRRQEPSALCDRSGALFRTSPLPRYYLE